MIFITGTDTGVGKTLLTALLLAHLRARGTHALALKPFCSGSRADAALLRSVQDKELSLAEINPCFFPEPLSPLAASRIHRQKIPLNKITEYISVMTERCECLLVEGVGGLLVPLSKDCTLLDLIAGLNCEVLVVARNRLGTINHTLLTVGALRIFLSSGFGRPAAMPIKAGAGRSPSSVLSRPPKVVLMQPPVPDASSSSNPSLLAEFLHPVPVLTLPFLGRSMRTRKAILSAATRLRRHLARLLT